MDRPPMQIAIELDWETMRTSTNLPRQEAEWPKRKKCPHHQYLFGGGCTLGVRSPPVDRLGWRSLRRQRMMEEER